MPVSSVSGVSKRANLPGEQPAEPVGKTCRSCRIDRPIAGFFPSRFTADGYSERCRSCVAAAAQRDRAERERRRPATCPKTRSLAR
jgi:hypothetical protein